jgi:hypothetical protein
MFRIRVRLLLLLFVRHLTVQPLTASLFPDPDSPKRSGRGHGLPHRCSSLALGHRARHRSRRARERSRKARLELQGALGGKQGCPGGRRRDGEVPAWWSGGEGCDGHSCLRLSRLDDRRWSCIYAVYMSVAMSSMLELASSEDREQAGRARRAKEERQGDEVI